jgi:putative intracellular protease/amidase
MVERQFENGEEDSSMKKILLVVAGVGFQEKEYFDTKTVLESAGFEVVMASDIGGEAISDSGNRVKVNITLDLVDSSQFDGIFFIGGSGALKHLDNQESNRILNEAMILQKPYGAICIALRILARAHVLVGKEATGWDEDGELSQIFAQNNVGYVREPVVVDGNIVTARDRFVAKDFAQAIVHLL